MNWEEHEKWLAGTSSIQRPYSKKGVQALSNLVKEYRTNEIQQKYESAVPRTPEEEEHLGKQIRREIDDMLKELAAIRKHLLSTERIPLEIEHQTDMQRILTMSSDASTINWERTKKLYTKEAFQREIDKFSYIDPNTGFKWSKIWGGPMVPDEWNTVGADPEWGWNGSLTRKRNDEVYKKRIERNPKLAKKMKSKPGEYEWDSSKSLLWNIWNQLGSYHLSN